MCHSSVEAPESMYVKQENQTIKNILSPFMQCPREPMSSVRHSPSKIYTTCRKISHCVTLQPAILKACLPLYWDIYSFLPLPLLSLSVKRTRQVKQVT